MTSAALGCDQVESRWNIHQVNLVSNLVLKFLMKKALGALVCMQGTNCKKTLEPLQKVMVMKYQVASFPLREPPADAQSMGRHL